MPSAAPLLYRHCCTSTTASLGGVCNGPCSVGDGTGSEGIGNAPDTAVPGWACDPESGGVPQTGTQPLLRSLCGLSPHLCDGHSYLLLLWGWRARWPA